MSDRIFVHFPACASDKYEEEWRAVIRTHPSLGFFYDRVEIFSTPLVISQLQKITEIRNAHWRRSYLLYALLYVLTRMRLPPAPSQLRPRPLFLEDRFKLRFHAREMDNTTFGIFVPLSNGMWPYDMWRNARRLLRQGKSVWQIVGGREEGWRMVEVVVPPSRAHRLGRKDTMRSVGIYAEPKKYPSLFSLIRDTFRNRE